jgi:hypothetical protein
VLAEYQAAAQRRGSFFVQVNLECGVEENVTVCSMKTEVRLAKFEEMEIPDAWPDAVDKICGMILSM